MLSSKFVRGKIGNYCEKDNNKTLQNAVNSSFKKKKRCCGSEFNNRVIKVETVNKINPFSSFDENILTSDNFPNLNTQFSIKSLFNLGKERIPTQISSKKKRQNFDSEFSQEEKSLDKSSDFDLEDEEENLSFLNSKNEHDFFNLKKEFELFYTKDFINKTPEDLLNLELNLALNKSMLIFSSYNRKIKVIAKKNNALRKICSYLCGSIDMLYKQLYKLSAYKNKSESKESALKNGYAEKKEEKEIYSDCISGFNEQIFLYKKAYDFYKGKNGRASKTEELRKICDVVLNKRRKECSYLINFDNKKCKNIIKRIGFIKSFINVKNK